MLFIQLNNKGGSVYDDYLLDAKSLMTEVSTAIDQKHFSTAIQKGTIKSNQYSCSGEICQLKNSAVPGKIIYKGSRQSLKNAEVKDHLNKFLMDNENFLDELLNTNENHSRTEKEDMEDESSRKEFQLYYKSMGFDEKDIQHYASGNIYKLFIEGYTAVNNSSLKNEILLKNLFLSKPEFGRLLNDFKNLETGVTPGESKKAIDDAFKSIIKAYKGGNISDKQFKKYSIKDLMQMITNLPVKNKLFELGLDEILTEKNEERVHKIQDSFGQINQRLKQIEKSKMNIYDVGEQIFYWVPEKTFSINEN